MGTNPKVGIVILNWNHAEDTIECLKSLEMIDYPDYEIIVIDNDSSDDSPEEIKKAYPNIKLKKMTKNLGFAEGCNVGIKYTLSNGADYVLLLNNDTVVDKNFLTELIKVGDHDPKIGMLGPKIYFKDNPKIIWCAGVGANWILGRWPMIGYKMEDKGQYDEIKEVDGLTGAALLVKKKVIDKIGLLDTEFFLSREETDWCIRAKTNGFKIVYVPKAVIWHKVSASTGGDKSPLNIYYGTRNNLLLLRKHNSLNLWKHMLYILALFYFLFLFMVFPSKRDKFSARLRGIIDFYLGRFGQRFSRVQ